VNNHSTQKKEKIHFDKSIVELLRTEEKDRKSPEVKLETKYTMFFMVYLKDANSVLGFLMTNLKTEIQPVT
jgi:hypothetical protein